MQFYLYNTLSRKKELFVPLSSQVGIYACGPTVYDYSHIGHLRKYAMDDVLVRTLRWVGAQAGFKVKHVQNITDVGHLSSDADTGEDKLEKGARKYHKTAWQVAQEFEEFFFKSMDLMNNLRPDVSCRATEHIEEQLKMVLELERKGFTYVVPGDGVYFDTSLVPDYGQLAQLDASKLKAGARVEQVAGKRHPTDFAVWKFEKPGENRAMVWPSPWCERSFPGWHIECSAMSVKYLGEQFDIHTGGIDHIPVHHPNEIAQTEAATNKKPFVKYWVHHNHLMVEGTKMSKSLGNFFTIDDILAKGFSPAALRLLFLSTHYRGEQNFTWRNLAGMQKSWEKLAKLVQQLEGKVEKAVRQKEWFLAQPSSPLAQQYDQQFFKAMLDDLQTPDALVALWAVTKDQDLSVKDRYHLLLKFDEVLGLGLAKLEANFTPEESLQLPEQINQLLAARQKARDNQDWTAADQLRTELAALGYQVKDVKEQGQVVTLTSKA